MKKKYFGNKIDENDYITVERAVLKKINSEIIVEKTDTQIDENAKINDEIVYIERKIFFNTNDPIDTQVDKIEENSYNEETEIATEYKEIDGEYIKREYCDISRIEDTVLAALPENTEAKYDAENKIATEYLKKEFSKMQIYNTDKLSGDMSEFYSPVDKFSARNLNRPIFENFEDVENIYETLQNICKTLYGQKQNGILPDVFEEMNPDKVIKGRYLNKNKVYIRIPTGAFFAKLTDKQAEYYKYSKIEDNQYSRDFYIDNDHNAAIIFIRPNVELAERQLAEHFNINLNDQDNDIRLHYYFEDSNIVKRNLNDRSRSEELINKDNVERCSRTRKIKYYLTISKTNYNYQKTTQGNTIITSTPFTERLPANKANDTEDSFELIKQFGNRYKTYLSKIDDFFSLEEVIEFPVSWDVKTISEDPNLKENPVYVIFFDPKTTEVKEDVSEVSYSFSKRFGLCSKEIYESKFIDKTIKLFEVEVTKAGKTGQNWIDDTDVSFSLGKATGFLKKIDRTTFDIKNVNITNLLNDLVIENREKNINISEAHIKPKKDEKNNISIGFNNLGYSNEDKERNPLLLSDGDKDILGENNIAIGTNTLMNTESTTNTVDGKVETIIPKNNIAIGYNTLRNIKSGSNNIAIGYGHGFIYEPKHLINIGENFTSGLSKIPKSSYIKNTNYNIVIGYNNGDKLKIGSNETDAKNCNIIIGYDNNGNSESNSIKDNNIIFGKENKIVSIDSNNIIIGKKNTQTITNDKFLNNNILFGNDNILKNLNNNNIIIGNDNQKGIGSAVTTLSSDSIMFGNMNKLQKNSNVVIGNENEANDKNSIIIGKRNKLTSETDNDEEAKLDSNSVFGIDNVVSNSIDTYTVGLNNNISDSSKNITIGFDNTAKNELGEQSDFNFVVGRTNIINNSDDIFVFGKGNSVKGNNSNIVGHSNKVTNSSNNIIIGNNNDINDLDNAVIIGNGDLTTDNYDKDDIDGNNFINKEDLFDIAPIPNDSKYNKKPSFVFGNYKKANNNKASYFIKLDEEKKAFIRSKQLIISTEEGLFVDKETTTPKINVRNFIFQNPKAEASNNPGDSYYNSLVPNAGTINCSLDSLDIGDDSVLKYKSFLGATSDGNYIISIRDKNGYGENKAFVLSYNLNRVGFNLIGGNKSGTLIDTNGGQTINNYLGIKKDDNNYINFNGNEIYIKKGNSAISLNPDEVSSFSNSISAQSFIANSARSLKTDIKPTKYKAIEEINKIEVVDFYFKSDKNKEEPKIGFVADDTDAIFSTKNKNSMDLYNTVGMLLKAVQELSAENKELKNRIEKLEK